MTGLSGGLAIAGFILPQTILVAAGAYRLASAIRNGDPPVGAWALLAFALSQPFARLADARGTVVVVPLVCLGLAVAAELLAATTRTDGSVADRPRRGDRPRPGLGHPRPSRHRLLRRRDRRDRGAPATARRRARCRGRRAHGRPHRAPAAGHDDRAGAADDRPRHLAPDRDRGGHRRGPPRRGRATDSAPAWSASPSSPGSSSRSAPSRRSSSAFVAAILDAGKIPEALAYTLDLVLDSSGLLLVVLVAGAVLGSRGARSPLVWAGLAVGAVAVRPDAGAPERPRFPRQRAAVRGPEDGPLLAVDDRRRGRRVRPRVHCGRRPATRCPGSAGSRR